MIAASAVRKAILSVLLLAVFTACSTTESERTTSSAVPQPAAEPTVDTAPLAVDTTTKGTAAVETTPPTEPVVPEVNGPGVAEDTVKIGVVDYRDATAQELGGLRVPEQGDRTQQANVLVEAINAAGGLGGRNIELVFQPYDTSTDSPQSAEALCNAFTQDDKVFAVVLFTQYQTSSRACYANADTLMIDQTLTPFTGAELEKLAPYLWLPELPLFETVLSGQVESLVESGWFGDDAVVGIMQKGDPMAQAAVKAGYLPALEAAGLTPVVVDFDSTDFTGASIGAAIVTMQQAGVTHVLFAGNPDTAAQFGVFALGSNFTAPIALTTFDLPGFFTDNAEFYPPGLLDTVVGMGFLPAADVRAPDFPATEAEKACMEPLTAAGIAFEGRANARSALLLCDAFSLLKAGADGVVGGLSAASWAKAVVAADWTSAVALGSDISQGPAPVTKFRPIAFDPAAQEFVYSGPEAEF